MSLKDEKDKVIPSLNTAGRNLRESMQMLNQVQHDPVRGKE